MKKLLTGFRALNVIFSVPLNASALEAPADENNTNEVTDVETDDTKNDSAVENSDQTSDQTFDDVSTETDSKNNIVASRADARFLDEWNYEESDTEIILKSYIGSNTAIVVLGKHIGKQVILESINKQTYNETTEVTTYTTALPTKTVSVSFVSVDGQKVKVLKQMQIIHSRD